MLVPVNKLLMDARKAGYAVGAFNVYNLEGILAVIKAAEENKTPAIIQFHPAAVNLGGSALIGAAIRSAEESKIELGVHLDHCPKREDIITALALGVKSVMADGSHLDFENNIGFVKEICKIAHDRGSVVEGELGKLSGSEDGLVVEEYEQKLTDPARVEEYILRTGVDALAVCIGNVHGKYSLPPKLDYDRLDKIAVFSAVPIVLHGASGLPEEMIDRCIRAGVAKINVNTEVRTAYMDILRRDICDGNNELTSIIQNSVDAMAAVVSSKIKMFRRLT